MSKDELLVALCKKLVADPRIVAEGWSRIVLVGVVQESSERMHGFRFGADGRAHSIAPSDAAVLDLLRDLRNAMAASDKPGKPWVSCLLKIDAATQAADTVFEYADAARWTVTPVNRDQRAREFALA